MLPLQHLMLKQKPLNGSPIYLQLRLYDKRATMSNHYLVIKVTNYENWKMVEGQQCIFLMNCSKNWTKSCKNCNQWLVFKVRKQKKPISLRQSLAERSCWRDFQHSPGPWTNGLGRAVIPGVWILASLMKPASLLGGRQKEGKGGKKS